MTQDAQQMDIFFPTSNSRKLSRACDAEFKNHNCSVWHTHHSNFVYVVQVVKYLPAKASVYTNGVWVRNITFHDIKDIGYRVTPENYPLCGAIPAQRYMFDICFLLDGSGSILEEDFQKMGYYIAKWIRESCNSWKGRGQNYCVYSSNIRIRFNIVQTSNFATEINNFDEPLDNTVYNLEHLERPGGLTDIGDGLAMCHKLFSRGKSKIPDGYLLYNKVVLISDGNYTKHRAFPLNPTNLIGELQSQNVEIFGVSVYEDTSSMWDLVSDPKSTHLLDWNMYGLTQSVQLVSAESRLCRQSNCEFRYCSCNGCVCPNVDGVCGDYTDPESIVVAGVPDSNVNISASGTTTSGTTTNSQKAIKSSSSSSSNIVWTAVAASCLAASALGVILFIRFRPKKVNTIEMSTANSSFQENPLYSETKRYDNPLYVPLDSDY
ncbi:uncharacterized protein LOC126315370 isoform X2 [Schistocerca gregaria]|nr:uncharacterized protein LOC126315370 isoform X2 [Schistocerca gregaria]